MDPSGAYIYKGLYIIRLTLDTMVHSMMLLLFLFISSTLSLQFFGKVKIPDGNVKAPDGKVIEYEYKPVGTILELEDRYLEGEYAYFEFLDKNSLSGVVLKGYFKIIRNGQVVYSCSRKGLYMEDMRVEIHDLLAIWTPTKDLDHQAIESWLATPISDGASLWMIIN